MTSKPQDGPSLISLKRKAPSTEIRMDCRTHRSCNATAAWISCRCRSTVQRASLHNVISKNTMFVSAIHSLSTKQEHLSSFKSRVGGTTRRQPTYEILKCPACGSELMHLEDEVALRCINPACRFKLRNV